MIAIQYLVINHGAVRTAEVTARFTLDALPGKQMAIDADLNAGLIDETQARARREQIAQEAEFYGAMDGAARFSQRDALATILITAINIVAGLPDRRLPAQHSVQQALKTYTILTVGDGLVTMIPSLLVSVAGGIVVTLASSGEGLGPRDRQSAVHAEAAAADRRGSDVRAGTDSGAAEIFVFPAGRAGVATSRRGRRRLRRAKPPRAPRWEGRARRRRRRSSSRWRVC